jgi:hypothetical protein
MEDYINKLSKLIVAKKGEEMIYRSIVNAVKKFANYITEVPEVPRQYLPPGFDFTIDTAYTIRNGSFHGHGKLEEISYEEKRILPWRLTFSHINSGSRLTTYYSEDGNVFHKPHCNIPYTLEKADGLESRITK